MACATTLSRTKRPFTNRNCASREARVNPAGATSPESRARGLSERTSSAAAAKSAATTRAERSRNPSGARCELRRALCASEKATAGRESAMRA